MKKIIMLMVLLLSTLLIITACSTAKNNTIDKNSKANISPNNPIRQLLMMVILLKFNINILIILKKWKLLLVKAKELNIKMLDNELKESYKVMRMQMSSIQYVKGDEENISKDTIEGLRDIFILQKIKGELGSDIDKTLEQLRKSAEIKYYN